MVSTNVLQLQVYTQNDSKWHCILLAGYLQENENLGIFQIMMMGCDEEVPISIWHVQETGF